MNKRILELMDECGLWIDYDNREVTRKELEFFGEQIVQECLSFAQSYASQQSDYAAGRGSVAQSIREHFGVEE